MAIDNKTMNKLAISGGIAGFVTPFLLQFLVMPILNFLGGFVPQFALKLADNPGTINVNISQSLTGLPQGIAEWLFNALGVTVPANAIMVYVMAALGGALFFVIGGYLADAIGLLKGTAIEKTRRTIFVGSLVVAVIMGAIALPPQIGFDMLNLIIAFGINAGILAWLYSVVDPKGKMGLIPY